MSTALGSSQLHGAGTIDVAPHGSERTDGPLRHNTVELIQATSECACTRSLSQNGDSKYPSYSLTTAKACTRQADSISRCILPPTIIDKFEISSNKTVAHHDVVLPPNSEPRFGDLQVVMLSLCVVSIWKRSRFPCTSTALQTRTPR